MRQLLVAVVIAVVVGTVLPGCAGGPFKGVCGMKPIGENEQGVNFFRYYCEPE